VHFPHRLEVSLAQPFSYVDPMLLEHAEVLSELQADDAAVLTVKVADSVPAGGGFRRIDYVIAVEIQAKPPHQLSQRQGLPANENV